MVDKFSDKVLKGDDQVTRLTFYVQNPTSVYATLTSGKIQQVLKDTGIVADDIRINRDDKKIIEAKKTINVKHDPDQKSPDHSGLSNIAKAQKQISTYYKAALDLVSKCEIDNDIMKKVTATVRDAYNEGLHGVGNEAIKIEKFSPGQMPDTGRMF